MRYNYYSALIIIFLFLGCDSKKVKTVYVDELPPIDSTTTYRVIVDENGKTIEEYQSDEFKKIIEAAEASTKGSHLYSITRFQSLGVMDTTSTMVEGTLQGKDIDNHFEIILVSEIDVFTQVTEEQSFKFSHIPNGLYHIFIKNSKGVRTLIEPLNLESGHIYSLEIKQTDK